MAEKKKPGCLSQIFAVALVALVIGGCRSCSREPERRPPAAERNPVAVPVEAPRPDTLSTPQPDVAVNDKRAKEPLPADAAYVVLRDKPINAGAIRDVVVRIPEPLSEADLKSLANRIKADSTKSYQKTSIFFLLPGQEVDAGAWARAVFAPALQINIIGATAEQKNRLDQLPLPDGEVIGDWYLDAPGSSSHRITLFRRDGKVYMRRFFGDGSSGEAEVMPQGRHRYFEDNPFGDWMQINERGNLDFYGGSEKRRAYTAAKTAGSPPLLDDPTTDESVAQTLKTQTLEKIEQSLEKIGEEKKEVGKTRNRDRMKQLIEAEKHDKTQLLKAKNKKDEDWLQDVRRMRGE
jgi:hypothetical protein